MTDDEGADGQEHGEDDDVDQPLRLTPEEREKLRRVLANIQLPPMPKISLPSIVLPESTLRSIANLSGILEARHAVLSSAIQPILDRHAEWQTQVGSIVVGNAFKSLTQAQLNVGRITDQFAKNIDFTSIAASLDVVLRLSETFAAQQADLLKNLGPALEAMRASFYPPNLREIDGLKFEDVEKVVMIDGIPLYGVPSASVAEALVRAQDQAERREIIVEEWKTIAVDCREVVQGCGSQAVEQYVPFALGAIDALEAEHTAAAQALAGSLVDSLVNGYFGVDRYKFTPSKKNPTNDAYNEFTIREWVAFAPMWQAYQQFFVTKGDSVPVTFSRHATAHAVGQQQFNLCNAVQGIMFTCSLLFRLDEEAASTESAA